MEHWKVGCYRGNASKKGTTCTFILMNGWLSYLFLSEAFRPAGSRAHLRSESRNEEPFPDYRSILHRYYVSPTKGK